MSLEELFENPIFTKLFLFNNQNIIDSYQDNFFLQDNSIPGNSGFYQYRSGRLYRLRNDEYVKVGLQDVSLEHLRLHIYNKKGGELD